MSRRFTGVTDINGRKIYTGDIVEMHYFGEVRSLQGAYVEERYVVGKVGCCWGRFYTEQKIGEQRRYYWDKYLEEPHEELAVVKYNPCYHCTDGLYDRCADGMCKYKWEPWKGSVDALTIDIVDSVEVQEMNKQELIQAAKEISDICQSRGHTWDDCSREPKCQFFDDKPDVWQCVFCIRGQDGYPPKAWDIERLERESNE